MPEKDKKLSYVLRFNENLSFEATGKRVDFNDLDNPEYMDLAKQLRNEGKSLRDIVDALNEEGFKVSKSTLQRRLS